MLGAQWQGGSSNMNVNVLFLFIHFQNIKMKLWNYIRMRWSGTNELYLTIKLKENGLVGLLFLSIRASDNCTCSVGKLQISSNTYVHAADTCMMSVADIACLFSGFLLSVKTLLKMPSSSMLPESAVTALVLPKSWCSQTFKHTIHTGYVPLLPFFSQVNRES